MNVFFNLLMQKKVAALTKRKKLVNLNMQWKSITLVKMLQSMITIILIKLNSTISKNIIKKCMCMSTKLCKYYA